MAGEDSNVRPPGDAPDNPGFCNVLQINNLRFSLCRTRSQRNRHVDHGDHDDHRFCHSRARMQAKNTGRLARQAGSMLKWLVLNPIRIAGFARSLTTVVTRTFWPHVISSRLNHWSKASSPAAWCSLPSTCPHATWRSSASGHNRTGSGWSRSLTMQPVGSDSCRQKVLDP